MVRQLQTETGLREYPRPPEGEAAQLTSEYEVSSWCFPLTYLIHNRSWASNTAYITACFVWTRVFNGTENYFLMIRGKKNQPDVSCCLILFDCCVRGRWGWGLFLCDYHPSCSYPRALLHCKRVTRTVTTWPSPQHGEIAQSITAGDGAAPCPPHTHMGVSRARSGQRPQGMQPTDPQGNETPRTLGGWTLLTPAPLTYKGRHPTGPWAWSPAGAWGMHRSQGRHPKDTRGGCTPPTPRGGDKAPQPQGGGDGDAPCRPQEMEPPG